MEVIRTSKGHQRFEDKGQTKDKDSSRESDKRKNKESSEGDWSAQNKNSNYAFKYVRIFQKLTPTTQ